MFCSILLYSVLSCSIIVSFSFYCFLFCSVFLCFFCPLRFQVLTTASMKFRFVFWDVLPCKIIVYRRFRGTCYFHHQGYDDGGNTYLWNVGRQLFYTAVHPRRQIWTVSVLHYYLCCVIFCSLWSWAICLPFSLIACYQFFHFPLLCCVLF
jgi:hypothetical protein